MGDEKHDMLIALVGLTLLLVLVNTFVLFYQIGQTSNVVVADAGSGSNTGTGNTGSGSGADDTGGDTGHNDGGTMVPPTTDYSEKIAEVINMEEESILGDPDAPVTIIEFSDLECPFCKSFHSSTYDLIFDEYIVEGKVNFVYKHYPLTSIHPNAQKGAEAVECATEQGNEYRWEMIQTIFDGGALSVEKHKQFAEDMGLDTEQFNSCLDDGKYAMEVQNDLADGNAIAGSIGTPTFFINGEQVRGAQAFSTFQAVIDSKLEGVE